MNKNLKYQYYLLLVPGMFVFLMIISVLNYLIYLKKNKLISVIKMYLIALALGILTIFVPDIICSILKIDGPYFGMGYPKFLIFLEVVNVVAGLYIIRVEKNTLQKYS